MEINVKEARGKIGSLLKRVEEGEEVIILKRGKRAARLVPVSGVAKRLPSLQEFRSSIKMKDEPLSKTVVLAREEERY
jgi:prevent-host-death family protein